MSQNWKYNGKDITDEDIPESAIGFIYLITQISTGKKYIGRKMLTAASTKMVNGVKKKIRKESDWKSYWSSSPWIKEYIKENGSSDFSREIIIFCEGKGSMAYIEECLLYSLGVLENKNYLNDNIRAKVYRKWIHNKDGSIKPEILELRKFLNSQSSSSS